MRPIALNTGGSMPPLGFGTWELSPNAVAADAVEAALKAGYRLIDTATLYGNEAGVGQAIRRCGIPREEIFVVTKVWNSNQGFERTLAACEASLQALGLDYIDLYLIHWPASPRRHDSWRALEQLYEEGTIKAAGVSNYTVEHLEELEARSSLQPAVNQIELHPFIYQQQLETLRYCQARQIAIQAYSPLTRRRHPLAAVINQVAERYHKTPEQILIRWCIDHGTVPLPRSGNPQHIQTNIDVFDFELDEDALQQLDAISDGRRVTWDPAGMGHHSSL